MIELARYVLEMLRNNEEFILYRGRSEDDAAQVLVLSPVLQRPALRQRVSKPVLGAPVTAVRRLRQLVEHGRKGGPKAWHY